MAHTKGSWHTHDLKSTQASVVFEGIVKMRNGGTMQVDPTTGEVAGVFESVQPSDTDMGAKVPKQVMVQGLWYGQLG